MILCINKEEKVIIPKDAIRFRIIANSNTNIDQTIKKQILKNLGTEIVETNSLSTISETRKFIKNELPKFTEIVDKTIKENNYNNTFDINYGKNYFPRKEYKNIIYEEGEYESLVITLGDGKGKNFWCILFPPLCNIDEENIQYTSLIKETLEKYF